MNKSPVTDDYPAAMGKFSRISAGNHGHSVFHSGQSCEGATAALSSAELPENRPYRMIRQAADNAPYFTPIE